MRILVFGAGAIGSLIGGLLTQRHDVVLVGRGDHVDAIRRRGLRITGRTEMLVEIHAMTEVPTENQDVVIISTKAYDTGTALNQLKRFWRSSLFVTLQNGLRNAEIIARRAEHVVAGTTSHGVTFVEDGHILHAGSGDTYIGPFKNVSRERVSELSREFTLSGLATQYIDNVWRNVWMKVIVNAAINPITSVAQVRNGLLLKIPQLSALMRASCEEGSLVARLEGQDITSDEIIELTQKVAKRTALNRSSMLQDLRSKKKTEIAEISGALVKAGEKHDRFLPTIETIMHSVSILEAE